MLRQWVTCVAVVIGLLSPAWCQSEPQDTVRGHFAAIAAEEYSRASEFFSAAFLRAFRADLPAMDRYYLARRQQLDRGYEIVSTHPLDDEGIESAIVSIDFGAPEGTEAIGFTERMHYYLIREKAGKSAPLADADGWAWRIDIYDALDYPTLADARRRPYLYTREAWPEDEGHELKSRQGLFRIQFALDRYYEEHGQYPFRLRGGDNRRDELIGGGYLQERYPLNGFTNRPMQAVEFAKTSKGDCSYYSVDADGDGRREGYWLLLHGKVEENLCFSGYDAAYVLNEVSADTQVALARRFAEFWLTRAGEHLTLSATLLAQAQPQPTESLVEPLSARLTEPPTDEQAAVVVAPVQGVEYLEPLSFGGTAESNEPQQSHAQVSEQLSAGETGIPSTSTRASTLPGARQDAASSAPTVAELLAMAQARVAAQGILRGVGNLCVLRPGEPPVEGDSATARAAPEPTAQVEPAEKLTVHHYGW